MSPRIVEPELLDELPPEQIEAQSSRRDLRRINYLMGHAGAFRKIWASTGAEHCCSRLVDLGGGDGTLVLRLARSLSSKPPQVVLVDRQPVVGHETSEAFARLGCSLEVISADVYDWLVKSASVPGTFLVTNLFLHHFKQEALRQLLLLISRQCQTFVACEPRRGPLALGASHLLGFIGCNAVTRHDAVVSVKAGFRDSELTALWPTEPTWRTHEGKTGLFSHLFWATRNDLGTCQSRSK